MLGTHLGFHISNRDVDLTKKESSTNEVRATHMLFTDNPRPHFQDHNSWHYFPKVDMNTFDGFNSLGWVIQMEHYFFFHGIINDLNKVKVGVLYLDSKCWQWWQWYKKAYGSYIAWTLFMQVLYASFERDTNYLGWLTKLRQTSTVIDYIVVSKQLEICIEGLYQFIF